MKHEINSKDLVDLIHWARRYCDGRQTWAPRDFNEIYDRVMLSNPDLQRQEFYDKTLTNHGQFFPYAQDGGYNAQTKVLDATYKFYFSNDYEQGNNEIL